MYVLADFEKMFLSNRFKKGLEGLIRSVRIDWYPCRSITKLFFLVEKSCIVGSDLIFWAHWYPN